MWPQLDVGPLHGDSDVGLYRMVSEFLIGGLGGHGLFPEVRGEAAGSLEDGIQGGCGQVSWSGSAAPV